MSNVVREDVDNLTAVLTVTLEKKDYEPKYKSELDKYRQQSNMKGFRKGRTPMSMIRKMYGLPVLSEVVNDMLQRKLFDYLQEENIDILGQPLPSKDQELIDFDVKNLKDYTFKFDIGLSPEVEVEGVSEEATYQKYTVEVSDEMIDEEIERMRKQQGERIFSEEDIQEGDLLRLHVVELENGEPKEEGVENSFSILVDNIASETLKEEVLTGKQGDTLRFNIFELEKNADEAFVRKHLLELEEEDEREINPEFEATIEEVSRVEPAELDQAFFDNTFGEGEVSSEEEARAKIRENIVARFENQAGALLFRDIQEKLMEENELPLPDDFLKRWLKASNEEVPEEEIEKQYEGFAKNLTWTLIRNKLVKRFELEVGQQEITEYFKDRVRGYFGGQADENLLNSMAMRLMEDRKQLESAYEDIITDKVAEAIEDHVTIEPNPITVEAFEEVMQQAQAEAEAQRNPAVQEEEE